MVITIIIQNIFCYQLTKKVLNNVTKYLTALALHYQNKLSITFCITGPLGNIAATYGSRGNSRANSRTGSKENLCEDCVQNPLDLVDASIQVQIRYLTYSCSILLDFYL